VHAPEVTVRLFSLHGPLRPVPYLVCGAAILLCQHLAVIVAFSAAGQGLEIDGWFLIAPLRDIARLGRASNGALIAVLAGFLLVAWTLSALTYRRARDADRLEWMAAVVVVPMLQLPAVLLMALLPTRRPMAAPAEDDDAGSGWVAAIQGGVAGIGLTLVAVALATLVFGAYGFGLFVLSPAIIGIVTGYLFNRRADRGAGRTAQVVIIATALGGIALLAASLEGAGCLILAAPLGLLIAAIGGFIGRALARQARRSIGETMPSLALMPLVFALETALPPNATFETMESVEIAASATVVWNAVVAMAPIEERPALPFRLGLAYPLGGEVTGGGVGALRHGRFSTGTAVERITEWIPGHSLAFTVTADVPAMHELSPYRHVHAPHVLGYFHTDAMRFDLAPLANGHTRLAAHASHMLAIDPVFYWLPMARWAAHENTARVLRHVRRQAERAAGG
jgi:uncharacterized membrane protein YhaH (DUF805 family)